MTWASWSPPITRTFFKTPERRLSSQGTAYYDEHSHNRYMVPFSLPRWLPIHGSFSAFQLASSFQIPFTPPSMTTDLLAFFPWVYCPSCCLLLHSVCCRGPEYMCYWGETDPFNEATYIYIDVLQAPELLITPYIMRLECTNPSDENGCRAAPACEWPQPSSVLSRGQRGLEDGDWLILQMWIPRRKIHLMWIPRRNLSAKMDSPRSTKGPKFINNKNLRAVCWQGLLMYWAEAQTEVLASLTMPWLFTSYESTTAGKPWFCL